MSDTNPAEKPINDGGTNAPQPTPDTTTDDPEAVVAEKPVNQGGGSAE